jgi:hypothetical protein
LSDDIRRATAPLHKRGVCFDESLVEASGNGLLSIRFAE